MAIVQPKYQPYTPGIGNRNCTLVSWIGLANGDTGAPVELGAPSDRSVHALGTFGAGGTVQIQGSIVPSPTSEWVLLTKPDGSSASVTVAAIAAILEATRWIRPAVTAGDGTTLIDIHLLAILRN